MELSEPIIALIAALFGGAGLKGIESLLGRAAKRADIATEIRSELRQEVLSLREQLGGIETRLDEWRRQYYNALLAFNELSIFAVSAGLEQKVHEIRERLLEED
ncbi:MAG: hypothetical protein LC650_00185 [Actinobacteria bacterium]|nr:hypothetical protein [Actinomycetota bacterium]